MTLDSILIAHRDKIIGQWVDRIHTEVSERYRSRPVSELLVTVTEGVDANFAALSRNDFSKINALIEKITRLRLEGGFSLSEVHAAFESYRAVILPI